MSTTTAVGKLEYEDLEFEGSLSYTRKHTHTQPNQEVSEMAQ